MTAKKVTVAQLRALARNEKTCYEIAKENNFQEGDPVRFTRTYTVTLDDIHQTVENSRRRRNSWKSFIEWAIALDRMPIADGLELPYDTSPLLPRSDYDYLVCIINSIRIFTIKSISEHWDFEAQKWDTVKMRRSVKEFFKALDSYFESYEVNMDKNPWEWYVAPPIGEKYLIQMDERMYDDSVSDRDCSTFRHFADTLAAQNNIVALRSIAYLSYSGSKAYPQNWKKSRSLLEKLFKLTMEPDYANSLGYIYYYGRCNGGDPEYEKAFPYFHYAAGQGLIEADYKLADMYLNGYGILKNIPAAEKIISNSFSELLNRFRQGEYDGKFADIALRKGRLMEYMAGEQPSEKEYFYTMAHKYYLMAQLAIKARRTLASNYGDSTVEKNIQEALSNIHKHTATSENGQLSAVMSNINELCSIDSPVKVRFEVTDIDPDDIPENFDEDNYDIAEAVCTIKIWFADVETGSRESNMIITIPELDYCGLENEATAHVFVSNPEGIRLDTFWCTRISINEETGMLEFYRFSELMQTLPNSIHISVSYDEPTQFYRMAEVIFPNSDEDTSYTYFCPQMDIHDGDEVLVMAGDHKTTAIVVALYLSADIDLELPFEKYKTILGKN